MKTKIKKDITIRFIPNLLENKDRTLQSFPYKRSWTIRRYLKKAKINFKDTQISVNGRDIKNLRQHLQTGDEIVIMPSVELEAIGAILYAVFWTYLPVTIAVASAAYSIYSALTTKTKMPSFDTLGDGTDEGSPSAAWTGVKTVRDPNGSIPIIYGRRLTGGTVINEFITTDGEKNYLHSLVAIGEGPLNNITLSRINKNADENFSNYTIENRLGTNDQTEIPNFEDLHDIHSLSVKLEKDDPYTYTTQISDLEAFEIILRIQGLYQQSSSGSLSSWSITYKVEYKLHADSEWTDLGETTISAKTNSEIQRIFRKDGLTAGQYDIRITKTSNDPSDLTYPITVGDLYLIGVDEINTDNLAYPNTAISGIKALAIDELSGDSPQYEFLVEGRKVLVPKIMNGEDEVDWEDYYWDPDDEKYKLLADDTELSWDGETYVERFSANPIWCVYDLMVNTRYGLGDYITTSDHDLDFLLEKSRHCDERVPDGEGGYEKRFRLDICIDSPQQALALIMQLAGVFRGMPFYSDEGKIRIAIDKPDTPVQLFGMDRITKDSFEQRWGSKRDIPNIVHVQFDNQDNYYEQEMISVVDEESLAAGDPKRIKQVRYYGTKLSYAIRYGRFIIKTAKYINRTINIRAGSPALIRQCGELIDTAHDVPQWGFSGSVKSGSTITKVKLDREVVIEESKSYAIRVDFSEPNGDGSPRYEEKVVSDPPGTYTEVTVSEAFSKVPAANDSYVFGELNKLVLPARIVSIKRERMGETEITAQEYNENIYDDSAVVIPENSSSALQNDIPNVQNLVLTERITKLADGTIEDIIDVWFSRPDQSSYYLKRYAKAKIYLSDNNGVSWEYRGETSGESFSIIGGLVDLQTYKISVVSVSDKGEVKAIPNSPQETITIQGKMAPPSDVTGFDVYQEGSLLYFTCDPSPDPDFANFEVREGTDWENGIKIIDRADLNKFPYPVGSVGYRVFMIKAYDRSGNPSTNPTYDSLVVIPPPDMNFINNFDLWSIPLEYKLHNLELVQVHYHNLNFNRVALAFKTAVTWEEREAEGKTWDQQEADGGLLLDNIFETSGYMEMAEPYDLGTIFSFKIITDADYKGGDNCTVTVQISTSEDGINYSAFEDVDATTLYTGRYIKFKIVFASTDSSYTPYLYDLLIYINAPQARKAYGQDIAVPIGGKDLIFDVGFSRPPRFIAVVSNGIAGYASWDKNDLTKDGNKVFVKDFSGSPIGTGEINYIAEGT